MIIANDCLLAALNCRTELGDAASGHGERSYKGPRLLHDLRSVGDQPLPRLRRGPMVRRPDVGRVRRLRDRPTVRRGGPTWPPLFRYLTRKHGRDRTGEGGEGKERVK